MMLNSEIQPSEPLEIIPVPGEGLPIQCPSLVGDGGPADILTAAGFLVASLTAMIRILSPYFPPKSQNSVNSV